MTNKDQRLVETLLGELRTERTLSDQDHATVRRIIALSLALNLQGFDLADFDARSRRRIDKSGKPS